MLYVVRTRKRHRDDITRIKIIIRERELVATLRKVVKERENKVDSATVLEMRTLAGRLPAERFNNTRKNKRESTGLSKLTSQGEI